jgi:hypothetical protein
MTATAKRRRYIFKTREDAERAYENRGRENGLLMAGLQALANGRVVWSDPFAAPRELRSYRFGYCHRRYESLCFETFSAPGQDPHTAIYDEDRLREERECYSRCPPSDAEARARCDGLRWLAQSIHDTRPSD